MDAQHGTASSRVVGARSLRRAAAGRDGLVGDDLLPALLRTGAPPAASISDEAPDCIRLVDADARLLEINFAVPQILEVDLLQQVLGLAARTS